MMFASSNNRCPERQVVHSQNGAPSCPSSIVRTDYFPWNISCVAFSGQAYHQQAKLHPFLRLREVTPTASLDFLSFEIRTQGITDILPQSEAME